MMNESNRIDEKPLLTGDMISKDCHMVKNRPHAPNEVNSLFQDVINQFSPQYYKEKYEISLINATKNFNLVLNRSLRGQTTWTVGRRAEDAICDQLDWWLRHLCWYGKLTFEVIAYSKASEKSIELFDFKLLNSDQYWAWKNDIYFYPENIGRLPSIKEFCRIPLKKCILMEWPKSYGGYKEYMKIIRRLQKLPVVDLTFNMRADFNPKARMYALQQRDFQIAMNTVKWGASQKVKEVSEYYKAVLWFRNCHLGSLLIDEIIDGMNQLISIINNKLGENAELRITKKYPSLVSLLENEKRWSEGKLTIDEVNRFLRKF